MDVAGEGGDDDALGAAGELPYERGAHGLFTQGVAGTLHIGGVGKQRQNALLTQLAEAGQVDDLAVDGRGVDLEVAGVNDGAHPRVDGEGRRVGDGVVHMEELHLELAGLHSLARLHGDELGGVQQSVLLQLQLDEPGGEAGAVDGGVDLLEDVGNGTDVVLVPVGDEHAPQAAVVLHQIADVGDDAVDAVHIVPGKGHAAVHDDDLAAVLIGGHVLADLIETAQRNDFQFFCHKCRLLLCFFTDAAQPPDMEKWPQQNKGGPPRRRPCIAGGGAEYRPAAVWMVTGKSPLVLSI